MTSDPFDSRCPVCARPVPFERVSRFDSDECERTYVARSRATLRARLASACRRAFRTHGRHTRT